jgi:hypothetical protein
MRDAKPFASLSSGLLARKGAAKPAMRPQGYNVFGGNIEDLGWNDMGQPETHEEEHVPSSAAALTPSPRVVTHVVPDAAPEPAPAPVVVEQQRVLRDSFEAEEPEDEAFEEAGVDESAEADAPQADEPEGDEPQIDAPIAISHAEPAQVVELARRRPAPAVARSRAAFTLRLDSERHLKLRLACAVTRCSAQQLVTGALDDFLNSLPELDALAKRVPAEAGKRSR